MKHSIILTLLTLITSFVSISISAYDFTVDGIYYNILSMSDMTCEVTVGDSKYTGDITIPSTVVYNGRAFSVTSIQGGISSSEGAFCNCKGLTSISIGNSITSIGGYSFYNCSNLTSVNIPNNLKSIGESAFALCKSLSSVEIPNSVNSIGISAFINCTSLSSVSIGSGVTRIGEKAFCNCKSLSSVEIPNSVNSIGKSAFSGCTSLSSVSIGSGVTSIDESAFSSCKSLSSVEIPNSVNSIGKNAFSSCTSLSTVKIPNSVRCIGNSAFSSCTSLMSIDVDKTNERYCSNNGLLLSKQADTLVAVPAGLISVKIPNSVRNIGKSAFSGCTNLTSVDIPESVTSIGESAFSGCTNLTSVDIPNSVTSIGASTFLSCGLTSIVIPNSVTSLGMNAFAYCMSLTTVFIGNGLTYMDIWAFDCCDFINRLEVGNSYGMSQMLGAAKTLVVAGDYTDTSFPDMTYSSFTKLDTIVCNLTTPPTLYDTFSNSQYMNIVVIVPTEALATYQASDVWRNFWYLQGGAESYTTGIKVVTIDNSGNKPTAIYDLQGHRLETPQKGFNIINGKKIFVK